MIYTDSQARKIIRAAYGDTFQFRLTTGCQIGVRPVYEASVGLHTLAWRKVAKGPNSAVQIGLLLPNGAIDWAYQAGPSQGANQGQCAPLGASVVDVGSITEYGLTQKLSNPVRCF
jgi:hypothetical protein